MDVNKLLYNLVDYNTAYELGHGFNKVIEIILRTIHEYTTLEEKLVDIEATYRLFKMQIKVLESHRVLIKDPTKQLTAYAKPVGNEEYDTIRLHVMEQIGKYQLMIQQFFPPGVVQIHGPLLSYKVHPPSLLLVQGLIYNLNHRVTAERLKWTAYIAAVKIVFNNWLGVMGNQTEQRLNEHLTLLKNLIVPPNALATDSLFIVDIHPLSCMYSKCTLPKNQPAATASYCHECEKAIYCSKECQQDDRPLHRAFCYTHPAGQEANELLALVITYTVVYDMVQELIKLLNTGSRNSELYRVLLIGLDKSIALDRRPAIEQLYGQRLHDQYENCQQQIIDIAPPHKIERDDKALKYDRDCLLLLKFKLTELHDRGVVHYHKLIEYANDLAKGDKVGPLMAPKPDTFMAIVIGDANPFACNYLACERTQRVPVPVGLVCSLCNVAFYCSKECQVRDWPEHRLVC
jgi:hypothetical protein